MVYMYLYAKFGICSFGRGRDIDVQTNSLDEEISLILIILISLLVATPLWCNPSTIPPHFLLSHIREGKCSKRQNKQRINLILNKHNIINSIPINPISHGQIIIEGKQWRDQRGVGVTAGCTALF